MKQYILFKSLETDPTLYFFGTDEEIKQAEQKEAEAAQKWLNIINQESFQALEIKQSHSNGRQSTIILHHSTRNGVHFQMSYIAWDGVPTMHENYIDMGADTEEVGAVHSLKKLLEKLTGLHIRKDIEVTLLTT